MVDVSQIQVATKATAHYLARLAATRAGGTPVDFTAGTVIIGDTQVAGGLPPDISDLIAASDVLNEVDRGTWVVSVEVNASDTAQTDIWVVIPSVEDGIEKGPWLITEYAITDENGVVCLVGTTYAPKLVSGQGGGSDIGFIAAEKESNGLVVITPPSAAFATIGDVITIVNASQEEVDVVAPLTSTITTIAGGLKRNTLALPAASTPADLDTTVDTSNRGFGRPATDKEFALGASRGGVATPAIWPRLDQVRGALDDIAWTVIPEGRILLAASTASIDIDVPADAFALLFEVWNIGAAGDNTGIGARIMFDGTSTFVAANYFWSAFGSYAGAPAIPSGFANAMPLAFAADRKVAMRSYSRAVLDCAAPGIVPNIANFGAGFQFTHQNNAISYSHPSSAGRVKRLRMLAIDNDIAATGAQLRAGTCITISQMRTP